MQELAYPKTTLFALAVAFAGIAATTTPKAAAPDLTAERQAAGRWFVDQLDRDRLDHPARQREAMNRCIKPAPAVDWLDAKRCYDHLMRTM